MYAPILPAGGVIGYRLLERTETRQRETLAKSAETAREVAYFQRNIGSVKSSADLLADRRLLQVALTAYGLEDEIDKTAFIKRVLDEGSQSSASFANRLNDPRWSGFSKAFGFGDKGSGYETSAFKAAVELKFRPGAAAQTRIDAADLSHFRANIGAVASIDDLLADPVLLDVSLAAFGLERGYYNDDHFRQLIEEGVGVGDEYAYGLGKSGWVEFAAAFQGLASGGAVESVSRFSLDVEREIARREVTLYDATAADASATKISADDVAYFRANIGAVTSGADLTADARLKEVALSAFGLVGTKLSDAQIGAILDGGVDDPAAPANQQADTAWRQMAASFDSILLGAALVPEFQIDIEVGIAERDLEGLYYLADAAATPRVDEDDLAYFSAEIDGVASADQLLADRRLLSVALTAFGLENEGKSDGFIRAILEEDPSDPTAFVNQTGGGRWAEFAKAFNPSSEDSEPMLWRYEIENRLIDSGAPEEDLFYLRQHWDLISSNLDLVLDTKLRDITLSAFGLEKNGYGSGFVLSMMISDPSDPNSFVNRLGDPRWEAFNATLGSLAGKRGNTALDGFVTETVSRYLDHSFEIAVGDQDEDLRFALNFRRRIGDIANGPGVKQAGWLQIMGDAPLRAVMDAVFNLPSQFAQLDVDAQEEVYRDRAGKLFGSTEASLFKDDSAVAQAIELFLLRRQTSAAPGLSTPGYGALSLMQQSVTAARSVNQSA